MKAKTILAWSLSLAFAAGAALAVQLPSVQVRGAAGESLTISCSNPVTPSMQEVARVLHVINYEQQTKALRTRLMDAAAEACQAGQARILVERRGAAKLKWVAME